MTTLIVILFTAMALFFAIKIFNKKNKRSKIENNFISTTVTKRDVHKRFNEWMKDNPRNFDENYLSQIKLEIIDLKKREDCPMHEITYRLYGYDYEEEPKKGSFSISGNDMVDALAESLYYHVVMDSDLMRKDKGTRELIDKAGKDANKIINQRTKKDRLNFWGWHRPEILKKHYMGDCHIIWEEQKKILKEKYNIDWKTPQERNPDTKFD